MTLPVAYTPSKNDPEKDRIQGFGLLRIFFI